MPETGDVVLMVLIACGETLICGKNYYVAVALTLRTKILDSQAYTIFYLAECARA
jgi:hypothetical protein